MMNNQEIVVWFSCGAASAIAAKKTIEKYGNTNNIRVVNNPVIEEHSDNLRFKNDVEKWLGVEIESAVNSKFPQCSAKEVWAKRKAMSFPMGAPCTIELKKNARKEFEANNHIDWHVLGFTLDEKKRHDRFIIGERDNVIPVLIDEGITKSECFVILKNAGIVLPEIYNLGYPNANCIGCVKATSPTYWNHVRKMHPHEFEQRAKQSRKYGVRLVRVNPKFLPWCENINGFWYDKKESEWLTTQPTFICPDTGEELNGPKKTNSPRIFLDELPLQAKGRPMKTMQFECGIFCEEQPPKSEDE